MLRYLLTRVLMTVPTVIGITMLAFALARLLPGDPVEVMLGERIPDRQTYLQQLERLGLDQPLPVQYGYWMAGVLRGDLGESMRIQQPVADQPAPRRQVLAHRRLATLHQQRAAGRDRLEGAADDQQQPAAAVEVAAVAGRVGAVEHARIGHRRAASPNMAQ
jgi:ABC-type microcin C transport system permease subunit YejB